MRQPPALIAQAVLSLLLLLLTAWAAREIELEPQLHLSSLLVAVAGTLAIWCLVPSNFKQWVFAVGTQVFLFCLLGLEGGGFALGFGGTLFVLMHLPVNSGWRMTATGLAGAGMLALHATMPGTISIVGGLFMFRSLLYLYEFKVAPQQKAPWINRWNYFFFLPNLAMPIFPILDWRNFRDNWAPRPDFNLALSRIANGILHLMLYRVIYHYAPLNPLEIAGPWDVLAFNASSYLLIVRLAGMFHLAVGIGGLFGWQLPRVFEHYFFARNFNDLWQRINRYWRDFMMRILYYPIYFRVKKLGRNQAMMLTLGMTFLLNWFLHSWQFMWLKGDFPVQIQDAIFWCGFGLVVIVNSLYTANRKVKRPGPWLESVQITGVFWFMAILWTIWNARSLEIWWELMEKWNEPAPNSGLASVLSMLGLSYIIALAFATLQSRKPQVLVARRWMGPAALGLFGLMVAEVAAEDERGRIWSDGLNAADSELKFEGYYDQIVPTKSLLTPEIKSLPDVSSSRLKVSKGLKRGYKPYATWQRGNGTIVQTNKWGHRGPDYKEFPEENTIRFVLTGGSLEVAESVVFDSTLAVLTESKLNQRLAGIDLRVEIICVAAGRCTWPQRLNQWILSEGYYHPHYVLLPIYDSDFSVEKNKEKFETIFEDSTLKTLPENLLLERFRQTVEPFMSRVSSTIDSTLETQWGKIVWDNIFWVDQTFPAELILISLKDKALKHIPENAPPFIPCWDSRNESGLSQADLRISESDNHFNGSANELNSRDLAKGLWEHLVKEGWVEE